MSLGTGTMSFAMPWKRPGGGVDSLDSGTRRDRGEVKERPVRERIRSDHKQHEKQPLTRIKWTPAHQLGCIFTERSNMMGDITRIDIILVQVRFKQFTSGGLPPPGKKCSHHYPLYLSTAENKYFAICNNMSRL